VIHFADWFILPMRTGTRSNSSLNMPKASKERVSKARSGPLSKQKPPIKQEGDQRTKPEPKQKIKPSAAPLAQASPSPPSPPPKN